MQVNPVIEKELKIKMRGWKSPALLTVYLGFLGAIVALFFITNNMEARYSMNRFNPSVALSVYNTLAIIQFVLIMFITPAMVGGSISGERERQTLDLLLCTNFKPFSIVFGKIFVSIAHIILLITASLPIMATVFLFGGVGFTDLMQLFGFYIVIALMLASIGVFYSTVFKKSAIGIIVTYLTLGFLVVGTVIIFAVWNVFVYSNTGKSPTTNEILAFLFANPVYSFSSVIDGRSAGGVFNIFMQMRHMNGPLPTLFGIEILPWMINMAFNLVLSVIFILLSAWRITPVKGRMFFRKKEKVDANQGHIQGA